jgi:outer membrane lipoprotein-sorting protein
MKSFYLLLTVLFLQVGTAFSQDAKAQGILDKLSSKMKTMKSFYIEFNATIKNAGGTNENATGKGWVKGNKFYASYGENTIISNGVKTWTVIKEERSVYESDATNSDDMNPKKLMTIWETGFKNKFDREEKLNGEMVYVINLFPKVPAKADYHTIVLFISKTKNELKKAVLKAKDGTVMTYSMTKFTANPQIDDKKFVFDKTKFPGYPVIKD